MPITLENNFGDYVSLDIVGVQSGSTFVKDRDDSEASLVQREDSKSSAAPHDARSKITDIEIEKQAECRVSGKGQGADLKEEALGRIDDPSGAAVAKLERGTTPAPPQDAMSKQLGLNIQKLAECDLSVPNSEEVVQEDFRRKEAALVRYRQIQEESFPDISIITGQELLQNSGAIGRELVLVDCRSDSERKVSIIPGALPQSQVEENVHQFEDRQIVAYCAIGRRSGNFLKQLTQKHEELKVRNLAGSLVDWVHLGGPLVDGVSGLPTNRLNLGGNGWLPYLPKSRNIDFVTDAT